MNSTTTLPAARRDLATKARDLRTNRQIPAEFYGAGKENEHLSLDYQTFRKIFKEAGQATVLNLAIDGGATEKVLVHKVDYDPLTDEFAHIDFIHVDMNKPVTSHVPVVLEGVSPAVKSQGGILRQNRNDIEVKCLPADLPSEIIVDISGLEELGQNVHVRDITTVDREKVEILENEETTILMILAPKTQEEVDADLEADVGEAKTEEDAAEGEAAAEAAEEAKEGDKKEA